MRPSFQYVTSRDGTRIAVSVLGEGTPTVFLGSIGFTSMESGWRTPTRMGLERLASRRKVIRCDHRGQGLSDRDVQDFSLEARACDLMSVVENFAEEAVDLIAVGQSTMVAIAYAARNSDNVRRMVLVGAAARGTEYRASPQQQAVRKLIEVDWDAYVRTTTLMTFGWTDIGLRVAEANLRSISPETFLAALQAVRDYDVTTYLEQVRCPTLVVRSSNDDTAGVSADATKQLAAHMPNARLMIYEDLHGRLLDEATVEVIEDFLNDVPNDAIGSSTAPPSDTAIIFFADIVDSTALIERMGDAAFREKARDLDSTLRAIIRENGGTPIEGKLLGDGVLATFTSASQAIAAALACGRAGSDAGLPLHLGLHAGDVIREEGNVYGGAVNIAARISGLSAPGEVLVSETVRSLARTSAGVSFEDRGEQALKGVGEPVRVWAVVEGE